MADSSLPTPDPDFPDDPALAAAFEHRLDRLAERFSADYWEMVEPLLSLVRLLHQQLWTPPVGERLLPDLAALTGLDLVYVHRLPGQLDRRAYLRELILRGSLLYNYAVVAGHLLDSPLGYYALLATLTNPDALPPFIADIERLRASCSRLFGTWQRSLGPLVAAQDDDPAAHTQAQHLLGLQVAGLLRRAADEPGGRLHLLSFAAPPWPAPPVPDEPVFDHELSFMYATMLRLGLNYLLLTAFTGSSAWADALRDELGGERLATLRQLYQTLEAIPIGQKLPLPLSLRAATDLHQAAHLSAALAASPAWDKLGQGFKLLPHDPTTPGLLESVLPPGVSLPPPDPNPMTVREYVELIAQEISQPLETHFGVAAPPLAANRALAARIRAISDE